jgi:hypothetical protein
MNEEILLKPIDEPVAAVLIEVFDPERYIAGAKSNLEYKVVKESGDWRENKPTGEKQNKGLETYTCTNHAGLNSYEVQQDHQIKTSLMSPEAYAFLRDNGYLDANGKPNYSERYAAIMTGTVYGQGNYVYKTPQLARDFGLIPESMLPFGNPRTWEEFINPAQITQEMMDLAARWKEIFVVQYENIVIAGKTMEVVEKEISKHLKQAPLTIVIACCPGYSTTSPIQRCEKEPVHCVLLTNKDENNVKDFIDSYIPFEKKLAADHLVPYLLKSVVFERNGNYTADEIAEAKRFVLSLRAEQITDFCFRYQASGECYQISPDGSIKYRYGHGELFPELTLQSKLSPGKDKSPIWGITEEKFNKMKPALIK